jgi:hypothetical protein
MPDKETDNLQDEPGEEGEAVFPSYVNDPSKFDQPREGVFILSRGEVPPDNDARLAAILAGKPDPLYRDSQDSQDSSEPDDTA